MKRAVPRYYHLDVEVTPERVGQVRRILTAHLRHWSLGHLVEPVCHCVDVLLRTIDEHATDKNTAVEMWWNGRHLITAVSDNDSEIPPPHYEPTGCLAQIAAHSDGWGGCATASGGKIIWFSRRDRASERAPLVVATPPPDVDEELDLPRELPLPAFAGAVIGDSCGAVAVDSSRTGAEEPPLNDAAQPVAAG